MFDQKYNYFMHKDDFIDLVSKIYKFLINYYIKIILKYY